MITNIFLSAFGLIKNTKNYAFFVQKPKLKINCPLIKFFLNIHIIYSYNNRDLKAFDNNFY